VSPADLAGDHPGRNIIDTFAELSLREVAFKVKAFIVEARRPSGEKLAAKVSSGLSLYTSEGTSVLIALGRDPRYVMEQLGQTDPKFTLRVYAHAMRFSEEDRARLKAFAEGGVLAPIGTGPSTGVTPKPGVSSGRGGFRTCDLSRVKNEEGADPEA
jgi:hypothetical protein